MKKQLDHIQFFRHNPFDKKSREKRNFLTTVYTKKQTWTGCILVSVAILLSMHLLSKVPRLHNPRVASVYENQVMPETSVRQLFHIKNTLSPKDKLGAQNAILLLIESARLSDIKLMENTVYVVENVNNHSFAISFEGSTFDVRKIRLPEQSDMLNTYKYVHYLNNPENYYAQNPQ